jgi:TPR repeat protein
MKAHRLLLTMLLVLSLSGVIHAETFDETLEKAQRGDAEAQYNLGWNYGIGIGVPEDDAEALKWYRLAADQGHAKAQYNLAEMYKWGEGVHENNIKAFNLYRLAAEQGYASAYIGLRQFADQGYARAQFVLGSMYAKGKGVPENDIKAYVWWSLAKAQGHEGAKTNLEIQKEYMSREQIAEGQALAARCFESNYKDCD